MIKYNSTKEIVEKLKTLIRANFKPEYQEEKEEGGTKRFIEEEIIPLLEQGNKKIVFSLTADKTYTVGPGGLYSTTRGLHVPSGTNGFRVEEYLKESGFTLKHEGYYGSICLASVPRIKEKITSFK